LEVSTQGKGGMHFFKVLDMREEKGQSFGERVSIGKGKGNSIEGWFRRQKEGQKWGEGGGDKFSLREGGRRGGGHSNLER